MSCENGSCGTGGWGGPLPGDPDSNSILTATPAFGGIDVAWTYPLLNPHAVAYTIVYRGLTPDFNGSMVVCDPAGGGFYFDKVNPPTEYFYWIRFISINGTPGDVIGPVSAVARLEIEKYIEMLTAQIDAGFLAQSLKTEIARIGTIDDKIFQEINDRLVGNQALADALALVSNVNDQTLVLMQNEVSARQDADSAQVETINLLYAQAAGNAAAITSEQTVRADADGALSQRIDSLAASMGDDAAIQAAITEERNARVDADSALANDINTLYTRYSENLAAINSEQTARTDADTAFTSSINDLYTKHAQNVSAISSEATTRANADGALASDITTLFSRAGNADSAIQQEASTRASQDSALSTQIETTSAALHNTINGEVSAAVASEATARTTAINNAISTLSSHVDTVEATAGNNLSQTQVLLQSNIDTVNGKVTTIGSLYTVKLNVNGLIGGFGTYNDGTTVQMGFDVDSFWVGRTGANMRKPFIISGSETFIDEAVINRLTFSKLRADDGSFIVENGKVKADYIDAGNITAHHIDVTSATSGSRTVHSDQGVYVYVGTDTLPTVELGLLIT